MKRKLSSILILTALLVLVSGCTITTPEGNVYTITEGTDGIIISEGATQGTDGSVTSASVTSVVITSISDSDGIVLYSGASTGADLLTVIGQVVATGDVDYSTVLSHNGVEQFVAVDASGSFTTYVSVVPGENVFQILVRNLEGEVIGRSPEYTINTLEVTTEEGEVTTSQATDLRVTMTWDTDDTDMDLRITDPNGCETYYADMYAISGAELDVDDTDGFGPEIFTLNNGAAVIGDYQVVVNYYSAHGVSSPVTVTVRVQVDEGTIQSFRKTFTSAEEGTDWIIGNFDVPSATNSPTGSCNGDVSTGSFVEIDSIGYAGGSGDYTYADWDQPGNNIDGTTSRDVLLVDIFLEGVFVAQDYVDTTTSAFNANLDIPVGNDWLVEVYAYDSDGVYVAYDYWYVDVWAGEEETTITDLELTSVAGQTSSGGTISETNNLVTVEGIATFSGTIWEDVLLYVNDIPQYVSVSSDGSIIESAILYPGVNTLRLVALDSAGAEIASSAEWTITASSIAASDMVVVLTWDTDYDDMDLHIVDPNGEDTYYSNMNTDAGELDVDDTEGYGPETFTLSSTAPAGDYNVRVYYYDNDGTGTALTEDSHLTVTITTSSGTSTYTHTFTPNDENTYWDVATVTIGTATPTISVSSLSIDSVAGQTSSGGSISTSNNLAAITGTAVFSNTLTEDVILYVNNVPQYVSVSSDGSISESAILYSGVNTLQLVAVDSSGNRVLESSNWTITASSIAASDMVVVLTWSTDADDMDLHVVDPNGVDTYYVNMNTDAGELDVDDTNGYGPETFTLSSTAPSGDYDVRVYYYSDGGVQEDSELTVTITTGSTTTAYTHTFTSSDVNTYWDVATISIS